MLASVHIAPRAVSARAIASSIVTFFRMRSVCGGLADWSMLPAASTTSDTSLHVVTISVFPMISISIIFQFSQLVC